MNHLIAFRQMEEFDHIKLVAIADVNPEKCQKYKNEYQINAYGDYKEMIDKEELTAVSIATPDHLHGDIAIYALNRGLHVFVEKPLDISSVRVRRMVELARSKGLLLQVDYHKRYDPFHLEIKQLAEVNKFGKFLYGYCYMENKITVPKDWFPHWAPQSSPGWFLGSHFIDLIGWLMQSPAMIVYATGQKGKLAGIGIDTFDSIQAIVTYANKAVITYHMSWILPAQFSSITNQGFRLIGTEGIIEVDSQDRGMDSCFTSEPVMKTHNSGFIYTVARPDGSQQYAGYGIKSIQHFAENVRFLTNGGQLADLKGHYPSGEEGYEVVRIVEAIHASIANGTVVELIGEKDKQVPEYKYV